MSRRYGYTRSGLGVEFPRARFGRYPVLHCRIQARRQG